jgi:hypothetical protein
MDMSLRQAAKRMGLFQFIITLLKIRKHVAGTGLRELAKIWYKNH